jgi:hypothetical protein
MWRVVAVSIVPATMGVVCGIFRHDMHEARARLAAQPTRIFHSTCGDIQYRVTGEGVPILVSHGITGGVDQAESLITKARNLPPNYRFIYVSRFGYLRIPNSKFVGLTGGHLLLGHQAEIRATIADFVEANTR